VTRDSRDCRFTVVGRRADRVAFCIPARTRGRALAVAIVIVLAACSSSGGSKAAPSSTTAANSGGAKAAVTAPGQTCAGTAADQKGASITWSAMRNPIYQLPAAGAKDQSLTLYRGTWHLLFSSQVGTDATASWRIASATSHDLVHWSPVTVWPAVAGVHDPASPDVTQRPDGAYVVTYQATPDGANEQGKLSYRTSRDLATWSSPKPLGRELHPAANERMIDAALAWVGKGLMLGYKTGVAGQDQSFEIAYTATGSIDGPWKVIGRPALQIYGSTLENYEFFRADGQWYVMATTNNLDRPYLARLAGPPADPASWLQWVDGAELTIPAQRWDDGNGGGETGSTFEKANSGYVCDARAIDGYYYVVYAGSDELTAFGGWGHSKIGIARSRDLKTWEVPPAA
jgi:hypothetical protein